MLQDLIMRLVTRSDFIYRILRKVWPIAVIPLGKSTMVLVSRHADVAEVLEQKSVFNVNYAEKIRIMMGGGNIFLGMDNDPDRAASKALMYEIMPPAEAMTRTKPEVKALCDEIIADATKNGRGKLDIVMELSQQVTTRFFGNYYGLPGPVDVFTYSDWARVLFQFQFADAGNDPALRVKVDRIAQDLRTYIDTAIADEKRKPSGHDNLLTRAIAAQAKGAALNDRRIRDTMMGLIVGGLPQPPMIVPQLIDVLLERPDALKQAQTAAEAGDDALLSQIVFEALRFFPLTPMLQRTCASSYVLAHGTSRAKKIKPGANVIALMRSAMHDSEVFDEPSEFRTDRDANAFMQFGWGPHECFGIFVNRVMTPEICKAILKLPNLRRASGDSGKLTNEGIFPKNLSVRFG